MHDGGDSRRRHRSVRRRLSERARHLDARCDIGETVGIRRTFGDHADSLIVSSTKSTTGHLLGAAGVAEAIFSILAIKEQVVPPTINLDNQDPDCDLDYTPNEARDARVRTAVSNSFGFGGTNASLIFRAPD